MIPFLGIGTSAEWTTSLGTGANTDWVPSWRNNLHTFKTFENQTALKCSHSANTVKDPEMRTAGAHTARKGLQGSSRTGGGGGGGETPAVTEENATVQNASENLDTQQVHRENIYTRGPRRDALKNTDEKGGCGLANSGTEGRLDLGGLKHQTNKQKKPGEKRDVDVRSGCWLKISFCQHVIPRHGFNKGALG